jgi:Flp pilus assembly protein TadB
MNIGGNSMNIDSLKLAWQASMSTPPAADEMERMTRTTRDRMRRYQRAARSRRWFGSLAFGLVLAMLLVLAAVPGVWLGMRIALVVWSIGLVACIVGLVRLRSSGGEMPAGESLPDHLQATRRRLEREIAYHHSLRWRFWLPFSVGLLAALSGRLSVQPDMSWLMVLIAAIACGWGLAHAPHHWPKRLQPELDALQVVLDEIGAR